ncbi:MAG: hypothetical protein IPG04_41440 [Polyangiaceae bacterium]|jgi:hypothetical protein|nr:hypothetical protein [Polyangiaceae bacterium]
MGKESIDRDGSSSEPSDVRPVVRMAPNKPTLTFGEPVKPRDPAQQVPAQSCPPPDPDAEAVAVAAGLPLVRDDLAQDPPRQAASLLPAAKPSPMAEAPATKTSPKSPASELRPSEVRRLSEAAMRAVRRSEPPRPPSTDRRLRSFINVRFDGLLDALEPHIGWMSEDLRADFCASLVHGEVLRAHDHLVTEQERYPKNITIKKTLALYRSQVLQRYEEAFGGLHVVPRKTRSFPSMRVGDRQRLAAAIDGESAIETVIRRSKLDRLRALETLISWFKAGSLEIIVPAGSPVAFHEATSARVYERPRITESTPPPAARKVEVSLHVAQIGGVKPEGRATRAEPPIARDEPDDLPALAARPGTLRRTTRAGLRALGGRAPEKATPLSVEAVTPPVDDVDDAGDRLTVADPIEAAHNAGRMGDAPTKPPPAPVEDFVRDATSGGIPKPGKLPDLGGFELDRASSRPPRADRAESVPPRLASVAPASVAPRLASVAPRPASVAPRASFAAPYEVAPERPREGRLLAGGLAILAALGGIIYFVTSGPNPPPQSPTQKPAPTAPATASLPPTAVVVSTVSASVASGAATDAKPTLMRLALDLEPPYAKVYLDGALLPKDKAHMIPRDGKEHELRVEAAGYRKRKLKFTADGDVRLVVSLEVVPKEAPRVAPTSPAPAPIYDEPSPL